MLNEIGSSTGSYETASASAFTKVPHVTAVFWILKILSTGVGEAASDGLSRAFGNVATLVTGVLLAVTLVVQMVMARYVAAVYWLVVVIVGIFGTMAADIPRSFGANLWVISAAYLLAVLLIFGGWHRTEGTLSFSSITAGRREAFYWAAVLATFALGTAVGDLTADVWGWGNLASGLFFTLLIVLPYAATRRGGLDVVAGFWLAYILTRPLGASFADWMGMPAEHGGLGWGPPVVAAVGLLPIIALVGYVTFRNRADGPRDTATA